MTASSKRVAFATRDGGMVDAGFGGALLFCVYELSPQGMRLIERRRRPPGPWQEAVRLVEDCETVFCAEIAPAPLKALRERGVKVEKVRAVIELILQALLAEPRPLRLSLDTGEVVREREVERRARAREKNLREEGDVR